MWWDSWDWYDVHVKLVFWPYRKLNLNLTLVLGLGHLYISSFVHCTTRPNFTRHGNLKYQTVPGILPD